ncbi:MAG: hypothetical protein P4L84_27850 [Isosphaeraceae bacterium]|nr:hypothetical protein [Isosphaeraceae bacterium]
METIQLSEAPVQMEEVSIRSNQGAVVDEPAGLPAAAKLPQAEPVVAPPPITPKNRSRALGRLLKMADEFLDSDSLHQASELYFELFERYDDTPEAEQAEDRLLDVALLYEQNGEQHAARSIYERLLKHDH